MGSDLQSGLGPLQGYIHLAPRPGATALHLFPPVFWGSVFILKSLKLSLTFARFSPCLPQTHLCFQAPSARDTEHWKSGSPSLLLPQEPHSHERKAGPYSIKHGTKRGSLTERGRSQTLRAFSPVLGVTVQCFTLSSFPGAPLSLVVFPCVSTALRGWMWLAGSLGRYRRAINHCNSKLEERGAVKCAKRGYAVAESLHFHGE